MSGNLRLNGATSGYSELAAPDVAGDQTFTFPATGGTLAIASNNTAGVPVPGYQQGDWTPAMAENSNITNVATNYTNRVGKWSRVGNFVNASFTINIGTSAGINSGAALCMINFPYKSIKKSGYYGSSGSIHANGWNTGQVVFANVLLGQDATKSDPVYFARSDKNGIYLEVTFDRIGNGSLIGTVGYLTDDTTWTPINGATVDS